MSFSVSFRGAATAPYDHWVERGRPSGTVFVRADRFGDNETVRSLMPAEGLAYVDVYAEFAVQYFRLCAQLAFDDAERTIVVERLTCERKNYWGDGDGDGGLASGRGGVGFYRRNLEDLGEDLVSLEVLVAMFFERSWTLKESPRTLPRTLPRIAWPGPARDSGTAPHGTRRWGTTVGVYHNPVDRVSAARTIQKCFRGWRVRMKTAFDPRTSLGAYYAMRGFRELVSL